MLVHVSRSEGEKLDRRITERDERERESSSPNFPVLSSNIHHMFHFLHTLGHKGGEVLLRIYHSQCRVCR